MDNTYEGYVSEDEMMLRDAYINQGLLHDARINRKRRRALHLDDRPERGEEDYWMAGWMIGGAGVLAALAAGIVLAIKCAGWAA